MVLRPSVADTGPAARGRRRPAAGPWAVVSVSRKSGHLSRGAGRRRGAGQVHAVSRHYKGSSQLFDELERRTDEVEQVIRGVSGFVGYYLVRTEDGGFSEDHTSELQ